MKKIVELEKEVTLLKEQKKDIKSYFESHQQEHYDNLNKIEILTKNKQLQDKIDNVELENI